MTVRRYAILGADDIVTSVVTLDIEPAERHVLLSDDAAIAPAPGPGWRPVVEDGAVVWRDLRSDQTRLQDARDAAAARRAELLAATDWVVIRAAEGGQPAPPTRRQYRQALRDITTQPGYPLTIDWPQPPQEADDE